MAIYKLCTSETLFKKASCLPNKCSCKRLGILCSEWCSCAENFKSKERNGVSMYETIDYISENESIIDLDY